MRQEKTQKRLVTKAKYVRVLGKKLTIYSFSSFLSVCGLIGLLSAFPFYCQPMPLGDRIGAFILGILVIVLSGVLLLSGRLLFVVGRAIEPVEPITRHNTDLLPAEESLVRSSTEPPADQQAHLLRAAQGGQETPQEQLLRSAQE